LPDFAGRSVPNSPYSTVDLHHLLALSTGPASGRRQRSHRGAASECPRSWDASRRNESSRCECLPRFGSDLPEPAMRCARRRLSQGTPNGTDQMAICTCPRCEGQSTNSSPSAGRPLYLTPFPSSHYAGKSAAFELAQSPRLLGTRGKKLKIHEGTQSGVDGLSQ